MPTPNADRRAMTLLPAFATLFALGLAALLSTTGRAQAGAQGQWRTLPSLMPINPIHLALMNNGKVLIVAGSGNVATVTNYQAAVFDPQTETGVPESGQRADAEDN